MEGVLTCFEAPNLPSFAKPDCLILPDVELDLNNAGDCSDGRSHASCSTDASVGARLSDTAEQSLSKTHHLLRHCLNNGQRQEALAHFSSQDVKEAAKEISRMGQRELQCKFKLVYGNTTHSNNNDWLRRKLFEAIGAAPLKANSKGKSRKPASKAKGRAQQQSAERAARGALLPAARPASYPPAGQQGQHSPATAAGAGLRFGGPQFQRVSNFQGLTPSALSLQKVFPPPPHAALASAGQVSLQPGAQQQYLQPKVVAGAPRPRSLSLLPPLPSSPLLGSVLDVQRYHSALSRDASDSDECSEGGASAVDEQHNNHASSPTPLIPPLALAPPSSYIDRPTQQQAQQQVHQGAGACQAGELQPSGLGSLDLGLPDTSKEWLHDAWGDASHVLGSFTLRTGTAPDGACPLLPPPSSSNSPTSTMMDDDELLLPLDLSAIASDTFGFA